MTQADDSRAQQTCASTAETSDADDEELCPFDFDDSFLPNTEQQRVRLTRSQKRNIRRRHNEPTAVSTTSPMKISGEELWTLQENDKTLEAAQWAADGELTLWVMVSSVGMGSSTGNSFLRKAMGMRPRLLSSWYYLCNVGNRS